MFLDFCYMQLYLPRTNCCSRCTRWVFCQRDTIRLIKHPCCAEKQVQCDCRGCKCDTFATTIKTTKATTPTKQCRAKCFGSQTCDQILVAELRQLRPRYKYCVTLGTSCPNSGTCTIFIIGILAHALYSIIITVTNSAYVLCVLVSGLQLALY